MSGDLSKTAELCGWSYFELLRLKKKAAHGDMSRLRGEAS
jgi:hypothetical protein